MRESNFSNPAQNKACVCISATLYDRRAIDCTATLPLINSLNHLAYLTSTSPRIREMVTLDGGLERLIRILRTVPKSAPSPGGSLIPTKASTTMEMQAIWKWSLAFQCVVNIGVRGSETVRTRVVEAGMVPVTVGVLESYLKMVDAHKQESKKEDRERESRERREERERERQRRAERHSRQNGDEGSNGSSSQRLIGNSSTDRSSRHTRENYIEEISESQAGPSNLSSSASSSTSSSRSNRQTTSNLTSTSRAAFNNTSDVTMQLESDPASIEISSVIPITSQTASSRPDDVEVVEAGSTTNNVNNDATTLSSFSDATEMVMSMASGSGTLTNVSSVEDLRSGSGSGSGSEGAEDAAMDADAEGDGDGSSIEDEGRSQVSSGRRNTVQQSHFTRPQQSVDPDAGADADTEMEGSQSNPQDEVRDQEQGAEDEERRTPRPSRRALAPLSSTSISQENSSTQSQAGPSSTPMGSRNQTITPSTTRPSRQSSSTSQSQSRSHPAPPTGAEIHVQATRAAEQVQVTRGPPALNVDAASAGSSSHNGGEMAYREEEVLLSLQLLAYLSKYAHVRVLFHNAEMAVTALPGPLSALDDDFDMLPVACSEEHEHGSACARPHEPRSPPARNVFSVAERFTLRSSRSGSSVSATAHSKLAPEIQYWAGVIMRNACRKDEGRGGIRQCANMLCGKWEAYPREFAKCRRCRKAKYCSKACQSKGWQMGHRFWCSAREDEGREKEREKEKSGPSNGREDGEVGNSRDSEGHQDQQNPLNSATPSINTPTDENAIPSTSRPHNSSHNHHHHHSHRNSNAAASSSTSESHTSRRERRQEASSSHAGSSRRRGSGVLHHANSSETSFAAASASTSDVDTDASMTTAPVGGIDLDDVDAASTGRDSEEDVRRAHRPRPGRSQLQHQRQHAHQPATSDDVEEENERGHSHHGPLPAAQRTDLAGRPLPPPVIASHDASHVLGAGVGRNDDLDLELIGRRGTPGATHEAEGLFANGDFDQMRWRSNTLTPGSRNQPLPDVDDSLGGPTPVIGSEAFVQSSTHYHQDQGSSSSSSSSTTSYPNHPPSHLRAPVARQPHRFASTSGTGISGGLVVNSASSSSTFTPGHAHAGSGSGLSIGLGQPSSPSYAHFQRGYGLDAPGPRSASSAANFPPSRSPNATAASSSPSPLSAGPIFTSNSSFFARSTSQPNGLEDYSDSLQHQSQEEDAMNLDDVVNQFSNDEDVQMN